MRVFLSVLAMGLLVAGPMAAEGAGQPAKGAVKLALSCSEMKPALRKAEPACAAMPVKALAKKTRVKPLEVADGRGTAKKKLIRMPWVTGVFQ